MNLLIMNRTQTIQLSNLKLNNQISWPIGTWKTQITEHLSNKKREMACIEQRRSQ